MRLLSLAIMLLLCLPLAVGEASAVSLSADAEWRYGEFEAQQGGQTVSEASHFTQQYTLMYTKRGIINSGRGGRYELSLGGEWNSVSSDLNGEDVDLDSAKVLYNGDLLLAPGGLPFRLHLYSHDSHRTVMVDDPGMQAQATMIEPKIIGNFSNGQVVQTGATLLLGIRNGSYLGRYREMLSNWPRILVDYKQIYVRDKKSRTPQHYRLRDLAFVSLNKKDNWFHYRIKDYSDYLDPNENYLDKAYILGTIDHTMKRQWINFTNWIQISADGSYQVFTPSRGDVPIERRYDLNMFATASRRDWGASTFATAHRRTRADLLERSISVPLYMHGRIDRDTSWRLNLSSRTERTNNFAEGTRVGEDNLYSALRVEALQNSPYRLNTEFQAEVKDDKDLESYGVRAGVELFTNKLFRHTYRLFGAYSLSHFADDVDVDSWEHNGRVRVERDFSWGGVQLEENLVYSNGTIDRGVADFIQPGGVGGLEGSDTDSERRTGASLRSTTRVGLDTLWRRRLDNRLSLIYDYLRDDQETQDQIHIHQSLRYDRQELKMGMENRWIVGDDVGAGGFSSDDLQAADTGGAGTESFSHRSTIDYARGRLWELGGRFSYDSIKRSTGTTRRWELAQEYQYNLFTSRGLVRKLAELSEELSYERFDTAVAGMREVTSLTLGAVYFPYKVLELGGDIRYRSFDLGESGDLRYTLLASLDFEKFKVDFDYQFATTLGHEGAADSKEHRWEVKVKKIF